VTLRTLLIRSLTYHWRMHLPVVLGIAVATAVLTGALLVGESMRRSLRDAALGRIGRVDTVLASTRFFREALAAECATGSGSADCAPVILLRGGVSHADSGARANGVQILGVDSRYWALGLPSQGGPGASSDAAVVLNEPVAAELGARPGDDVLLRVPRLASISTETLLGRRDDVTVSLRLSVQSVIPARGLGGFSLRFEQSAPRCAFVPLATLQRALGRAGRVNTLLVGATGTSGAGGRGGEATRSRFELADLGLRIRRSDEFGYLSLETESLLIDPAFEAAARTAAQAAGLQAMGILTYLANEISVEASPAASQPVAVPYSTVAAIADPTVFPSVAESAGGAASVLQPGEIVLNDWAARELGAAPGASVRLTYFVAGPLGALETRSTTFRVRGVVPLSGAAEDAGFAPEHPGITDSATMADWDPPFPIDLSQIRRQDEDYWKEYRATPKAFIALSDGQRIWAEQPERFGRLTALRLYPRPGHDLTVVQRALEQRFLAELGELPPGFQLDPLRERALAASRGATDFGGLFIGFSLFLIASAALLASLLMRLGVERRAAEAGLLLAQGFSRRQVARLLMSEAAALSAAGSVLGVPLSALYAWLMLAGLRSVWSSAVGVPFLQLQVSTGVLLLGAAIGVLVALASLVLALRGLTVLSPRALLAGDVTTDTGVAVGGTTDGRTRPLLGLLTAPPFIAACSIALAALLLVGAGVGAIASSLAFFGTGAVILTGVLLALGRALRAPRRRALSRYGGAALLGLAVRNARRNRRRTVATVSLIACAAFGLLSLEAFRLDAGTDGMGKGSGTGGFALVAESAAPLPYDLGTPAGRERLSLGDEMNAALDKCTVYSMRLSGGDESSCLNLYQADRPRIVGASRAFIERGGFAFASSLAQTDAQRANPWRLLTRDWPDGTIPAIGDEAAVLWQMHLGLGQDLEITDERGQRRRLRFVALLRNSMLQSEVIVAESAFLQLFPSISGTSFFPIEAPPATAGAVAPVLERSLAAFSLDARPAAERLAAYLAVQNTYISAFQTLGGLGLLLGTVGVAAVMLRNIWERRRELALLRALGFGESWLRRLVLLENGMLVVAGLLIGVLAAGVAISPQLVERAGEARWGSLGLLVLAVFACAMIAGATTLLPALRAPLLPALRTE
jgi:ABC-type lipoprotein release transport system permease subunit